MKHAEFQSFLGFMNRQADNGNRISPIVWGTTGCGKTQAVTRYADSIGAELVVLHLASQDPGDLIGLPSREGDRTVWLRPDWMPAEDDERKFIIFLDEFNRANKYVLDCMLPFLLDGTLHTHKVPRNTTILAAANPGGTEDYNVTTIDDKAMLSRLCHVTLDNSHRDWSNFVKGDVHPAMIEATEGLVRFKTCDIPEVTPDPRSMHLSGVALKDITSEEYSKFGWEFLSGMVGPIATCIDEHIQTNGLSHQRVRGKDVLASYPEVREEVLSIHDTPDAISKLSANVYDELLTTKLTKSVVDNAVSFLLELPEEILFGFFGTLYSGEGDTEKSNEISNSLGSSEKGRELVKRTSRVGK